MKSKKSKLLFAIVCVVLFLMVFLAFIFYLELQLPNCKAEITGTPVDNEYNNYVAGGNLVRIGDKLYYNYRRSEYCYGLIEISDSGSKRIFWGGVKWFGSPWLLNSVQKHNGSLLTLLDDKLHGYSFGSGSFAEYAPLNTFAGITMNFQASGDRLIFQSQTELGAKGSINVYDGNSTKAIIQPGAEAFYAMGDDVYYLFNGAIRKYNLSDDSDILAFQLDGYSSVYTIIVEKDYLVFSGQLNDSDYSVYKINILDKRVETVCTGNDDVSDYQFDICSWNVFDGMVYVASHSGLVAYDLATNESRHLHRGYVEECYVVDDTWVYFSDKESNLWRVTQSGDVTEMVFGK